jgi:DNA-binding transcriptional LysR family regulator
LFNVSLVAHREGAVSILPDVMSQGLVRIVEDVEATPAEAHIVLPQRQWLPAKTRAFVEHLQAHCAKAQ